MPDLLAIGLSVGVVIIAGICILGLLLYYRTDCCRKKKESRAEHGGSDKGNTLKLIPCSENAEIRCPST